MADTIRAGMIGCDTSHVIAFTRIFHDSEYEHHVPGVKVVAAYPSFSPDIEMSVERVGDYKKQLAENYGVTITETIAELVEQVDAIMIESVDGRRHLKEFQAVAHAGKPVFIDKPFTASLEDARKIVDLARQHEVPCFSASSLRFDSNVHKAATELKSCGKILGCDAFSPAHLEKTNPGLFWYGIHGVEILYTIMGPGCRTVRCTSTPDADFVLGIWKDGRLGTLRGIRKGKAGYGARVLCSERPPEMVYYAGDFYPEQMKAVAAFFRTGEPPVPLGETLEICAFMDAALRSTKQGGVDVKLDPDSAPTRPES